MSDAKLRELERTWQATGRPQDEAAYLVESVRAGRLTQDELELAAWARHPAACHALGGPLPGPSPDELSRWVAGLARWGRPLCVRVALRAVDEAHTRHPNTRGHPPAPAHLALRQWTHAPEQPTEETRAALRASAGRSLRATSGAVAQLGVATSLAAKAALEDDFAQHSANAVVRCEAILGEGECKAPLVALVIAHALRRPEPPLSS